MRGDNFQELHIAFSFLYIKIEEFLKTNFQLKTRSFHYTSLEPLQIHRKYPQILRKFLLESS